jgi:uncharacterized protein (TIGR00369 family)
MGGTDEVGTLEWQNAQNQNVPLHVAMGLEIVSGGPPAIVTMELTSAVRGAVDGSIHGGILATLADVASAVAVNGAYDFATEVPVTTDLHVRYFRQPRGGPLTATAELVHRGRRLLSCESVIEDANGRVLARSTATYMIVPQS